MPDLQEVFLCTSEKRKKACRDVSQKATKITHTPHYRKIKAFTFADLL